MSPRWFQAWLPLITTVYVLLRIPYIGSPDLPRQLDLARDFKGRALETIEGRGYPYPISPDIIRFCIVLEQDCVELLPLSLGSPVFS